jgi:hypothetical protein
MAWSRAREPRLQVVVLGAVLTIASAPSVRAQGFGLGPDPFQPYNQQYAPYTYPSGPGTPGGGQSMPALPRTASYGANQYGAWLAELEGASRARTEKYGIGLPYFRSAIDPAYQNLPGRVYEPNRDTARSFEETQNLLTTKYLAYFMEKDPKKRASLLKEYNLARRQTLRALTSRRGGTSGFNNAARRLGVGADEAEEEAAVLSQPRDSGSSGAARSSAPPRRSRGASSALSRGEASGLGPAPELPPSTKRSRRGATSSPTDVLNRARRFENERSGSSLSRPGSSAIDRLRARRPATGDDSTPDR